MRIIKNRFENAIRLAPTWRLLLACLVLLALHASAKLKTLWQLFCDQLGTIRPIHALLPATFLQIFVFVLAFINYEYFTPIFAAGNLGIVGLALIPVHIRKPKPLYHWV